MRQSLLSHAEAEWDTPWHSVPYTNTQSTVGHTHTRTKIPSIFDKFLDRDDRNPWPHHYCLPHKTAPSTQRVRYPWRRWINIGTTVRLSCPADNETDTAMPFSTLSHTTPALFFSPQNVELCKGVVVSKRAGNVYNLQSAACRMTQREGTPIIARYTDSCMLRTLFSLSRVFPFGTATTGHCNHTVVWLKQNTAPQPPPGPVTFFFLPFSFFSVFRPSLLSGEVGMLFVLFHKVPSSCEHNTRTHTKKKPLEKRRM